MIRYHFKNQRALAEHLLDNARALRSRAVSNREAGLRGWDTGQHKFKAAIAEAYGMEQAAHIVEHVVFTEEPKCPE